jgi:phage terminase large subunit GpA-like protein
MPLDGPYLANPTREAAAVMAEVLKPPPPVDFNDWARSNVVFGPESPFPGPYDPEKFPFFTRMLEVMGPEHPARVVVVKKSAQLGGTVLAQIFVGGSLDLDPGPVLYVHPTEGNAKRWVRTKWRPMIKATTALSTIISPVSSKEGGSSTLYQERRDGRGYLQISGANSEASLSMISMPRQVQDDLSKWELNNAGDPEGQADSRSKAFDWAKILKIGTPLLADNCRTSRNFKASTQEHYHVPCPDCGYEFPFEWENLLANLDVEHPERAHFTCPDCGVAIEQHQRFEMNLRGRWVAHNPGSPIIGFYLWSAYSPLESWQRICEAWIAAKGDPAKEQVFLNDTVGRAYEVQGEAPAWEGLRDRAEEGGRRRGIIPCGALLTTLSMDCQDNRVEWKLLGWGRDLKRWVIDVGVVEGHISEEETRAELDKMIDREWRDFLGGRRKADLAGIDGNAWTTEVFDWVRKWPQSRVLMLRGAKEDSAPPLAIVRKERGRDGKVKKYAKRFFNVGVSGLKLGLYKFLAKTDPLERGYVDLPSGLGDEYFHQLTAERREPVKRRDGFTVYRWTKPKDQANEQLDMMVYGEALAIRLGWRLKSDSDWDRLEAEREVPPKGGGQLDLEDLMFQVAAPPRPAPAEPLEQEQSTAVQSMAPGSSPKPNPPAQKQQTRKSVADLLA